VGWVGWGWVALVCCSPLSSPYFRLTFTIFSSQQQPHNTHTHTPHRHNAQGVLSPQDALLSVQHGAHGIIVSNHGGRQLDYSPTALDMLPSIVAAVRGTAGSTAPILMDGGIRRGTDVLKAIALGADAVLLGRPVLYGLAVGGQGGVEKVLEILQKEFELAMALAGCVRVDELQPGMLLQAGPGLVPVVGAAAGGAGRLADDKAADDFSTKLRVN